MLTIFGLSLITLMCIIGVSVVDMTSNNIVKSATVSIDDYTTQIDSWLSAEGAKVESWGFAVESSGHTENGRDKLESLLAKCTKDSAEVAMLYVGLDDNFCSFSNGYVPPKDFVITSRQWYKDAKASDTFIVTDPYVDTATGGMVVTIAKAIEMNNKKVGVIGADIMLDELQAMCTGFSFDATGNPILVTSGGNIIIHNDTSVMPYADEAGNEVSTAFETTYTARKDTNDGYFTYKDYTGAIQCVMERTVPTTGWQLYYSFDKGVLVRDGNKIVAIFLIAIPLICCTVGLICVFALRRCFKPFQEVEREAAKMTDGNLNVHFDYCVNDELGHICKVIEDTNGVMSGYVSDISRCLKAMAMSDFTVVPTMNYTGDFLPIKDALEEIRDGLRNTFNNINSVADTVNDNAQNVSAGATNLANITVEQSQLMDEINNDIISATDRIKSNTDLTEEANKATVIVDADIKSSNEQMNALLSAMNDIQDVSNEIQKMNKVIDDIAFQTNILALNASVEAARAGAAGKGFAVVADEVRNLAGKSADASKQTSELIDKATKTIETGVLLAEETAKSMNKVVDQVKIVNTAVMNIAVGSREQEEYMIGVSDKVTRVSNHIMTSAASAEESASASNELESQAIELNNMIREFKF